MVNKIAKPLFFISLFLAIGSVLYVIGSGKLYSSIQKDIDFIEAPKDCNLHNSECVVVLGKKKEMVLSIDDKPLESSRDLKYRVKTKGFDDEELVLNIVGVNMNMGFFEYTAVKVKEGDYEASGSLPSCMHGEMTWKISVISKRSLMGANFVLKLK